MVKDHGKKFTLHTETQMKVMSLNPTTQRATVAKVVPSSSTQKVTTLLPLPSSSLHHHPNSLSHSTPTMPFACVLVSPDVPWQGLFRVCLPHPIHKHFWPPLHTRVAMTCFIPLSSTQVHATTTAIPRQHRVHVVCSISLRSTRHRPCHAPSAVLQKHDEFVGPLVTTMLPDRYLAQLSAVRVH